MTVPAQILGEGFRAFEPRRLPARPERLDAGGFEIVDDAGAERRLRPDHHEGDVMRAAERDHGFVVGEIERDELAVLRDAGIAGRTIKPLHQRARRNLPRQRMLAAAGTEQENVHGIRSRCVRL